MGVNIEYKMFCKETRLIVFYERISNMYLQYLSEYLKIIQRRIEMPLVYLYYLY